MSRFDGGIVKISITVCTEFDLKMKKKRHPIQRKDAVLGS